jgi:hypothetical protein
MMKTKSLLLATLVCFIVVFATDYLWFMVVFKGYHVEGMPMAAAPNVPMHALGELCFAALLALIYPYGYKGGSPVSEGLKFGILMGLMYQLPGHIHMLASMDVPTSTLWFFTANGVVVGMLGGVSVAMSYGRRS